MLLMLREKGKYASATQNRRIVWSKIIWPLILEINDVVFSLKQYQKKRDIICHKNNLKISEMSRGLVSLIQKGMIIKEKNMYSIHFFCHKINLNHPILYYLEFFLIFVKHK